MSGSRWYKCDFHLHTSKSKCFIEDPDLNLWVQKVIDQKIDCIAITNHNSPGDIDKIKSLLVGQNIILFPGVEITCSDAKVHLLVLFDPTADESTVRDFIISAGIESKLFGDEDAYSDKSISDIATLAEKAGGIIIGAHVDQYSSLKNVNSVPVLENFFDMKNVLGVQITKSLEILQAEGDKNICRIIDQVKKSRKSFLTFSDNPSLNNSSKHGITGIGNSFTYVKMSENPTLMSLKQALLMSEIRVINNFSKNKLPKRPEVVLERIVVKDASSIADLDLEFNTGFNTIIGGRGSGKSSLLRILRIALNKAQEISSFVEINNDFESFFEAKDGPVGELAKIDVYIKNGVNKYKISLKNIKKHNKFDVEYYRLVDNQCEVLEVGYFLDVLKSLDLVIYSQKQLYDLSKDPEQILQIIDLKDNDIINIKNKLKNLDKIFSDSIFQYKKILEEYSAINIATEQYATILNKLNDISGSLGVDIDIFLNTQEGIRTKNKIYLDALGDGFDIIRSAHDLIFKTTKTASSDDNDIFIDEYKMITSKFNSGLKELVCNFSKDSKDLLVKMNSSSFGKTKKESNRKLIEIKEQSPDLNKILENKNILEFKLQSKATIENRRKIAEVQLLIAINNIKEINQELRQNRLSIIKRFIPDSAMLQIRLEANRNTASFDEALLKKASIQSDTYVDDRKKLIDFLNTGPDVSDKLMSLITLFKENRISELDLDQRFIKKISDSIKVDYYELFQLLPSDRLKIKYINKNNDQPLDLSKGSHGQKTSAILSILLHLNNSLIIIDQPEDDLDNKLIYGLIVKNIVENKSYKQMIMVTHNANIPVNGDADLIIQMNYEEKKMNISAVGEIDSVIIRNGVCDIMEGGPDAFQKRASRYGIN